MRFLVADDHSIVRMGVKLMLEADYSDVIIDEAESGDEIIRKIKLSQYDLIILDFQMPNTDTFSVIGNLLAREARLKILIYSMASEKVYAVKLLKAGVKGFLSKDAKHIELLTAVKAILQGGIFTNNELFPEFEDNTGTPDNPFMELSNKEIGIMQYMIQGKTTKEMAALLNLQLSTISTHKFRIYKKLQVSNLAELIALTKEYPLC